MMEYQSLELLRACASMLPTSGTLALEQCIFPVGKENCDISSPYPATLMASVDCQADGRDSQ